MNKPQYTPGPWTYSDTDKLNPDRAFGIVAPDDAEEGATQVVAEVCDGMTAEADARLIAAAPDLLEACLNLTTACELTDDAYYDAIDTAINIARAAIAKAKGTA